MIVKKKFPLVLFIVALGILLLRALELRIPNLMQNPNEDEYHHNYWILARDSLQNGLIVHQKQPLLDYFLRKHFWFPLLNYGTLAILGLGLLLLFGVISYLYIKRSAKADDQKESFIKRLLLVWAGFSLLELSIGMGVMLQQSLAEGVLFQSSFHLLRISVTLALFLSLVWASYLIWRKKLFAQRSAVWIENPLSLKLIFSGLLIFAAGALSMLFVPVYFANSLPSTFLTVTTILYPLVILLYLLLAQSALLLLTLQLKKYKVPILVSAGGIYLYSLLLVFSQGGVKTLDYELILRIPSIFYGTLLIVLAFVLAYQFFYANTRSYAFATGLAFVVALWIVYHPDNQSIAANGRHYILIALASVWWSYVFVMQAEKNAFQFDILSLFLANTHFFAFPLLIAAYGWQIIMALRERALRAAGGILLRFIAVLGITVLINWRPLRSALLAPPNTLEATANPILEGLTLWWNTLRYLLVLPNLADQYPLNATLVLILLALLIPGLLKDARVQRLYLIMGAVLPVLFIYIRWRSSFGFNDRYYSVLFGFGFVLLLLVIEALYQYSSQIYARFAHWQASMPLIVAAWGAILLLFFPLLDTAKYVIPDISRFKQITPNFTNNYVLYKNLRNYTPVMMLLYSNLIWYDDIPGLYLEYLEGGYPAGTYEMINSAYPPTEAKRYIETFLNEHANGKVALNWHEETCLNDSIPKHAGPANVLLVATNAQCVWVIEGASSFEEVREIAHSLNFLPLDGEAYCFDLNCE